MRDRLIELLNHKYDHFCDQCGVNKDSRYTESLADYLLENGGLFPPVKIGQELWDIHYNRPRKWEVVYLGYNGKEWFINVWWYKDRHNFKTMQITYPFLGKMWYFTKEEAERALKG